MTDSSNDSPRPRPIRPAVPPFAGPGGARRPALRPGAAPSSHPPLVPRAIALTPPAITAVAPTVAGQTPFGSSVGRADIDATSAATSAAESPESARAAGPDAGIAAAEPSSEASAGLSSGVATDASIGAPGSDATDDVAMEVAAPISAPKAEAGELADPRALEGEFGDAPTAVGAPFSESAPGQAFDDASPPDDGWGSAELLAEADSAEFVSALPPSTADAYDRPLRNDATPEAPSLQNGPDASDWAAQYEAAAAAFGAELPALEPVAAGDTPGDPAAREATGSEATSPTVADAPAPDPVAAPSAGAAHLRAPADEWPDDVWPSHDDAAETTAVFERAPTFMDLAEGLTSVGQREADAAAQAPSAPPFVPVDAGDTIIAMPEPGSASALAVQLERIARRFRQGELNAAEFDAEMGDVSALVAALAAVTGVRR